jgi:hypothetical protein
MPNILARGWGTGQDKGRRRSGPLPFPAFLLFREKCYDAAAFLSFQANTMARNDWVAVVTDPNAEYVAWVELGRFGLRPYLPQGRRRILARQATGWSSVSDSAANNA